MGPWEASEISLSASLMLMYSHLPARKASMKPHFLTKITYFGGKRESYFFTYDMNPVKDSQAHNPRLQEKGQLFD